MVVARTRTARVAILEIQELSPEVAAAFVKLEGAVSGLLSEADLEAVAEALEPGTTAAALLFEHVWATRFADAVRAANGELVLAERIPHAVVAEARASLLAAADASEGDRPMLGSRRGRPSLIGRAAQTAARTAVIAATATAVSGRVAGRGSAAPPAAPRRPPRRAPAAAAPRRPHRGGDRAAASSSPSCTPPAS